MQKTLWSNWRLLLISTRGFSPVADGSSKTVLKSNDIVDSLHLSFGGVFQRRRLAFSSRGRKAGDRAGIRSRPAGRPLLRYDAIFSAAPSALDHSSFDYPRPPGRSCLSTVAPDLNLFLTRVYSAFSIGTSFAAHSEQHNASRTGARWSVCKGHAQTSRCAYRMATASLKESQMKKSFEGKAGPFGWTRLKCR